MPVCNFRGKNFVAFVDISGFKRMMEEGKAEDVLKKFYEIGYLVLGNRKKARNIIINGLFISDCGILFPRPSCCCNSFVSLKEEDLEQAFLHLLETLREISCKLVKKNILITASISYGEFSYDQRLEFKGIGKNPIYGKAYLNAYLDNEKGDPKIKPGQIRILKENLPENIKRKLENGNSDATYPVLKEEEKYYYYYWMLKSANQINDFDNKYCKVFCLYDGDEKYEKLKEILKNYCEEGE